MGCPCVMSGTRFLAKTGCCFRHFIVVGLGLVLTKHQLGAAVLHQGFCSISCVGTPALCTWPWAPYAKPVLPAESLQPTPTHTSCTLVVGLHLWLPPGAPIGCAPWAHPWGTPLGHTPWAHPPLTTPFWHTLGCAPGVLVSPAKSIVPA